MCCEADPTLGRPARLAFVDPPRLPVIDFAPFEAGGPWRDHVAAQIDWAASEFGFFYIVGHGIDLDAIERFVALSRTFFLQDNDAKTRGSMYRRFRDRS
jgi:isopenicillin N synthase-like dioxygenase